MIFIQGEFYILLNQETTTLNICSDELESMSVKQLKEILMLNRVDFKGCCEKQELKERVERLWQDHVAAPRKSFLIIKLLQLTHFSFSIRKVAV